jgi:hypothetical protein
MIQEQDQDRLKREDVRLEEEDARSELENTRWRQEDSIEASAGETAAVDSFLVVCVSVTLVVTVGKSDLALQASF